MEEMAKEIVRQAPSIGAVIVLVLIFLSYLTKRDDAAREAYRALHEEHLDARAESRGIMAANNRALLENAASTARMTAVIEDLKDRL